MAHNPRCRVVEAHNPEDCRPPRPAVVTFLLQLDVEISDDQLDPYELEDVVMKAIDHSTAADAIKEGLNGSHLWRDIADADLRFLVRVDR